MKELVAYMPNYIVGMPDLINATYVGLLVIFRMQTRE
jgi:hypothetical protein